MLRVFTDFKAGWSGCISLAWPAAYHERVSPVIPTSYIGAVKSLVLIGSGCISPEHKPTCTFQPCRPGVLVLAWPGPALSKTIREDRVNPIPSPHALLEVSSFDNDFERCNQTYQTLWTLFPWSLEEGSISSAQTCTMLNAGEKPYNSPSLAHLPPTTKSLYCPDYTLLEVSPPISCHIC